MGRGEEILRILVAYERDGLYSGSTWLGDVARKVNGSADGRAVAAPIGRLIAVGLVERADRGSMRRFRPTDRGRKVNAILDRITAERGGKFVPRGNAGISFSEVHALR